jgi:hypothetical protein
MAESQAAPSTDRERLVARWLMLTRTVLPGMAAAQDWPISRDHCFMRVFLDHAEGGRWDRRVRRPAIRFMEDAALRRAVLAAEHVVAHPGELPEYNRRSLAWRRER